MTEEFTRLERVEPATVETNGIVQRGSRPTPCVRVQVVELGVFLLLILPSTVIGFFTVGLQKQLGFVLLAVGGIARLAALLALVLYFLWRNGEPVSRIGWTGHRPLNEVFIGSVCFIPLCMGALAVRYALLSLGLTGPPDLSAYLPDASNGAQILLAVFLVLVVAVTEETIFRGYLYLRFRGIFQSTTVAVLASTAIFAAGHSYQGTVGIGTIGAIGLGFMAVYLWRRSLVAPMTMHFLLDFLTLVVFPLFRVH